MVIAEIAEMSPEKSAPACSEDGYFEPQQVSKFIAN